MLQPESLKRRRMRVATFVIVLIVHAGLLLVFATLRQSATRPIETEASPVVFFLPSAPQSALAARNEDWTQPKRRRRATQPSAAAFPRPPAPESTAITPAPALDWRGELQIAANSELEREELRRQQPALLAPHDFSGVKPGSTDNSKHEFGWNHAATHRIEAMPGGGLLININDRCVIAWMIFPFPACRIGKIPVRGDLFDHLKDAPAPRP